MITGTALKMDNNMFNQFLQVNKEKINSIAIKNPSIAKTDEWYTEDFWDEAMSLTKDRFINKKGILHEDDRQTVMQRFVEFINSR